MFSIWKSTKYCVAKKKKKKDLKIIWKNIQFIFSDRIFNF